MRPPSSPIYAFPMLFPAEPDGAGAITVAARSWNRPTVLPAGTLKSPGGLLRIDEVSRSSGFTCHFKIRHAVGREDRHQICERLSIATHPTVGINRADCHVDDRRVLTDNTLKRIRP